MVDGRKYLEDGRNKIDVESQVTGTILASGQVLTAGHFLNRPTIDGEKAVFLIEGRGVDATILERQCLGMQDFMRVAVTFKTPPDLIAERLSAPERRGIRFDGHFRIRPGQSLFIVGFSQATGELAMPYLGKQLAVVPLAAVDGGNSGPIVLSFPENVRVSGMSGGPILAQDAQSGDLVVVGIVSYSQESFRFQRRLLYGLRLPLD